MKALCFVLCLVTWGCGVDFESAPTTDATSVTGQGGNVGTGGDTSAGGQLAQGGFGGELGAGGGPAGLVNSSLLARYYINEAASGQEVTQLIDAAPQPRPLDVHYTSDLSFTAVDGHRGLSFASAGDDARASVALSGTKFETLNGVSTITVEAVLHLTASEASSSRILHIGQPGSGESRFALESKSADSFELDFNGINMPEPARWVVGDLGARGRTVVHAVFDTNAATMTDRARLYLDGVRQLGVVGAFDAGTVTAFPDGCFFVLGNREQGDRTFAGQLYYVAVYRAALTDAAILQNTNVLLRDDD